MKLISGEPGAHQRAETFKMFTFSLDLNFDIVKSQKCNQSLGRIKDFQKVRFFYYLEIESEAEQMPGAHQRG